MPDHLIANMSIRPLISEDSAKLARYRAKSIISERVVSINDRHIPQISAAVHEATVDVEVFQ